jgi:CBS-domain-containing membrane protein
VNALVKDVMTTSVISVQRDSDYETIAADLVRHRISAVPVLDQDSRVIGVVSESDMLAKLALDMGNGRGVRGIVGIQPWEQLQKARAVTAAELMTSPAATASPEDTIEQAARVMYSRHVKRLPVVDAESRLAGIVSRTDLLAVYGRDDADIAVDIRNNVFAGERHAVHGPFEVTVQAGVVTVTGKPLTASQRWAIVNQARHVPGVVAVRDRLTHPAPGLESFDQPAR